MRVGCGGVDEGELLMCPVGRHELNLPEQLQSSLQRHGCSILTAQPGTRLPPAKPQILNICQCFARNATIVLVRNTSVPALVSLSPLIRSAVERSLP